MLIYKANSILIYIFNILLKYIINYLIVIVINITLSCKLFGYLRTVYCTLNIVRP